MLGAIYSCTLLRMKIWYLYDERTFTVAAKVQHDELIGENTIASFITCRPGIYVLLSESGIMPQYIFQKGENNIKEVFSEELHKLQWINIKVSVRLYVFVIYDRIKWLWKFNYHNIKKKCLNNIRGVIIFWALYFLEN